MQVILLLCISLGINLRNSSETVFLAVVAANQVDIVLHATTCGAVIAGVTCRSMIDFFGKT